VLPSPLQRWAARLRADNRGFSLIEIIIVIVIISIMSIVVGPRLTNYMGARRVNFNLLSSIIAKTFDDACINERVNFLVIHLGQPNPEQIADPGDAIAVRKNAVSVVTLGPDGTFVDSANRLLKYKSFPDSFRLEAVHLASGEKITQGNVFIPFYPTARADDAIIQVLVDGTEHWSVRIFKFKKEPEIKNEQKVFE